MGKALAPREMGVVGESEAGGETRVTRSEMRSVNPDDALRDLEAKFEQRLLRRPRSARV